MSQESIIEGEGDRLAKANGYLVRKMRWIGRRGAPDKFYARSDKGPFMIEYKRPGEEPDVIQEREIKRLREAGVQVFVVHNLREVRAIFTD